MNGFDDESLRVTDDVLEKINRVLSRTGITMPDEQMDEIASAIFDGVVYAFRYGAHMNDFQKDQ